MAVRQQQVYYSSLHLCFSYFYVIFTPLKYIPTITKRLNFFRSEYTINVYKMDFCTSPYSENTGIFSIFIQINTTSNLLCHISLLWKVSNSA